MRVYATKREFDRAWHAIENALKTIQDKFPVVTTDDELSQEEIEARYEANILQTILRAELDNMTYLGVDISADIKETTISWGAVRLKAAREAAGFTQQQLADQSGVSLGIIRKYEQGERDIRRAQMDTLVALAITLEVSPNDLV